MVKSVKMADIAKELNVSVVTVSKALSDQKGVSEEMRRKIKDLAAQMGYRPVHGASPERGKSYTIGVISLERYFEKFASFYWKMYQEVATKAVKRNSFTMLEVISSVDEENLEPPKLLQEDRVDGIIIIGKPSTEYVQMVNQRSKVPMVFLDFYDDDCGCDAVISSGYYGGYRLTNYLIAHGHTKIAYVGTLLYSASIIDRYMGYQKALLEHGIALREDWVIPDRVMDLGKMDRHYPIPLPKDMPTAFFCNCDVKAYVLIEELRAAGYRVPEDVSVVGFDDYLYPEYGDSEITTYAVDMHEMARMALKILTRKMGNGQYHAGIHEISGTLIERKTVADAK